MSRIFKELMCFAIRYSCIPLLMRNIFARNKVTIAVYHDLKADILDRHLKYLSKRYNFITLDLLVNAIYSKNWENIPQKSLIITLDDGHKGNFDLLEVFKKYNIKPTIYLCSQIIDTNRQFWFKVQGVDCKSLKSYSDIERLKYLNKNFGFTLYKEYSIEERNTLNSNEIMAMKDFVDFQSHSSFHPVLTTCTDDECKKEIFQSKEDIETSLGIECKHFSYPNGDYTEREAELVKKAGYLSARTIDIGWNDVNTNPYKLKAMMITDDASINLLAAQLSGITQFGRYLIKGSLSGKYPTIVLEKNESILTR